MDYGLTADDKGQLIALLDKIQANHCENYDGRCFVWNCTSKLDNKACPIEYEVYSKTNYEGCDSCFYCPVSIIRNVLEEE